MFKKETMFINVVKQNNNLKVEYKKYINNKEISEDHSTFLLDGDILPDNIVQKLNNLQNENDLSYISTLLLSDTTKLIWKNWNRLYIFSFSYNECSYSKTKLKK